MTLEQEQQCFLENEFLTLSINGALQHSSTYAEGMEKKARKEAKEKIQRALRLALCELAMQYFSSVREEEHLENIQELARKVEESCVSYLKGNRLRLGVAQKALNLYLKYLWCAGRIPTPPHCPFDATIIQGKKLLGFVHDNWTRVDDKETYVKWVRRAETKRDEVSGILEKSVSLSEWELRSWNGAQPGGKAGCP